MGRRGKEKKKRVSVESLLAHDGPRGTRADASQDRITECYDVLLIVKNLSGL